MAKENQKIKCLFGLLAFLLPILLLAVLLLGRGIYPFGETTNLRADLTEDR